MFWLDIGAKYQITGKDLEVKELNDEDDAILGDTGGFPNELEKLTGRY